MSIKLIGILTADTEDKLILSLFRPKRDTFNGGKKSPFSSPNLQLNTQPLINPIQML